MRSVGQVLRQAREERRWTQATAATKLAVAAKAADIAVAGDKSLSRLVLEFESGRRPLGKYKPLFLVIYDLPAGALDAAPANDGLVLPWTGAGARAAAREDPDMHRRMFLALGGAALTEIALDWLIAMPTSPSSDLAHQVAGRRLIDPHVDALDDINGRLRSMDDQFGGGVVLAQAQAQLRHVAALANDCRYTETVGRHLHASIAELLRVAGWTAFDSDQHALAQRYWMAGLHAAHAADDRALGANILGFLSCQAKDCGQLPESVRFAGAAAARHSGGSHRVTAITHMRTAQAHASSGDLREAQRAIDAAGSALRSATLDGDPVWTYWLTEPHWHEMTGFCWLNLGELDAAEEHLVASLSQAPGREVALRKAFLGQVHARRGEPEAAVEAANAAMDLLESAVDSERCIGHVRRVLDDLSRFGKHPAVTGLADRVHLLSA